MFVNRQDASRKLAKALHSYRGQQPLVLGLPRGGVVVAAEAARALGGELDVLFVKKLGAPGNPELAIGAIGENGKPCLNEVARMFAADDGYVSKLAARKLEEIRGQARLYRAVKKKSSLAGRLCILVDDGLATGASMIAAIQAVHAERPASIVVAVPVGPDDTLAKIREMPEVTDVICLEVPAWFSGVSQIYDDFEQVEDGVVVEVLKKFAALT
ncbi:MAG: phosphoribosyltransferase family protein [Verrucomicrobia bacterium]|nr:phosphoribosyltransferase family protein [Verrucomicrobiota bacterium]